MSKSRIKQEKAPHTLTYEDVVALGKKIVPTPEIPHIWQGLSGRSYDRSTPLRAREKGKIVAMGQYKGTLYFWRDEVEKAVPPHTKRGRPPRHYDEFHQSTKTGV